MTAVFLLIVLLGTAAIVSIGIYFTLRGFREVDRPSVEAKTRHIKSNPHDAAVTATLKQFFEGKSCAACGRSIPAVHAGELRPGLLNTKTHEAIAWADIPPASLSAMFESHAPICSNCLIIETLRHDHPELVLDRHRGMETPSH